MGILLAGLLLLIGLFAAYCFLLEHTGQVSTSGRAGEERPRPVTPGQATLIRPSAHAPTIVPGSPVIIQRQAIGIVRRAIAPAAAIRPVPCFVWEDRGWARSVNLYTGYFRTTRRSTGERLTFYGRIDASHRYPLVYIASPPAELRKHAKWSCFQLSSGTEYRMHWHRAATSVDDSILYIEKLLDESINGTRR